MIQRDGYCVSLWQTTTEQFLPQRQPDAGETYDSIIVGGGITGITTALLLQESGMKCLVLEAATLCYGTTGGTTAHLNTLLDTSYATISKNFGKPQSKQVAAAAARAIDLARTNCGKYALNCEWQDADAYLFARTADQKDELREIELAAMEAGLLVGETDALELDVPFSAAIRVVNQARFHPVKYTLGLARAFDAAGGAIQQHCRVESVQEGSVAVVKTNLGSFKARRVVFATHTPPGVNFLHLRCIPFRSYAMAARLEAGLYPDNLYYDLDDPYHYYRTHVVDGTPYLIGGGFDHKTGHEPNTEKCFLQLEAHLNQQFDIRSIAYRWSSQYYESADGLPYIGRLPGHSDQVYVATGFGGNGMTYSHVAAMVLRDILTERENDDIALFDPSRIKPIAGFKNFISHNADVASHLVKKLLPHHQLAEMAELAPGEAKVVKFNGQKIALYKDEEGNLHATSPTCTHMGCEIAWNSVERSWDCPCHGARFNAEGEVLNAPAISALQQPSLIEATADHQQELQHRKT